jgi:hypothetical protein
VSTPLLLCQPTWNDLKEVSARLVLIRRQLVDLTGLQWNAALEIREEEEEEEGGG